MEKNKIPPWERIYLKIAWLDPKTGEEIKEPEERTDFTYVLNKETGMYELEDEEN